GDRRLVGWQAQVHLVVDGGLFEERVQLGQGAPTGEVGDGCPVTLEGWWEGAARRLVNVHCQCELLEVVLARDAVGGLAYLLHSRQQQRDQDSDDGDNDQQLNQRERVPFRHGGSQSDVMALCPSQRTVLRSASEGAPASPTGYGSGVRSTCDAPKMPVARSATKAPVASNALMFPSGSVKELPRSATSRLPWRSKSRSDGNWLFRAPPAAMKSPTKAPVLG